MILFKVDDKIRIKKCSKRVYSDSDSKFIASHIGKIYTIKKIDINEVTVKEHDFIFYMGELESFEKYKLKEKVTILGDKGKIVEISPNDNTEYRIKILMENGNTIWFNEQGSLPGFNESILGVVK